MTDIQEYTFNQILKPKSFNEFVGQDQLKEKIRIGIEAAKKRNEHIPHILLSGTPGIGKTSLCNVIAEEARFPIKTFVGSNIKNISDVFQILNKINDKDILFIDEFHSIKENLYEILYEAMDDFRITIKLGGSKKEIIQIPLRPFTLIAATTKPGSVSGPMRSRFDISHTLTFYSQSEISTITKCNAEKIQFKIKTSDIEEIAIRSRGIPRCANRLLKRVRDYVQSNGLECSKKTITDAMNLEGIDEFGYTDMDRRYLNTIYDEFNGGPTGIVPLSSCMNEHRSTLLEDVEPYLLRTGVIYLTPKGRQLSSKGWELMGKNELSSL